MKEVDKKLRRACLAAEQRMRELNIVVPRRYGAWIAQAQAINLAIEDAGYSVERFGVQVTKILSGY